MDFVVTGLFTVDFSAGVYLTSFYLTGFVVGDFVTEGIFFCRGVF